MTLLIIVDNFKKRDQEYLFINSDYSSKNDYYYYYYIRGLEQSLVAAKTLQKTKIQETI